MIPQKDFSQTEISFNYSEYKPRKIKAIIENENEIEIKKRQYKITHPKERLEKWIKEENYIPKLQEKHEQ